MARGPCTFRKRDLTRAVEAVQAAGVQILRVKLETDGTIVIVTGKAEEPGNGEPNASEHSGENEWDHI